MAGELRVSFRVDTGGIFTALGKRNLAVHPAILAQIVREEGQLFVHRARQLLTDNDSIVTGDLWNAVRFDVLPLSIKGKLKAKFWVDSPYAKSVEFKTPRRQNPPTLKEIIAWKSAKMGKPDVAGGIRAHKAILEYGVNIHPFFWPAYRMVKKIFLFNVRKRILLEIKTGRLVAARGLKVRKMRRTSVVKSFRTLLYSWAKVLGWLHAVGIDVSALRAFMYTVARGMGDSTAVLGGNVGSRLIHRGSGGMTTVGIGASMPNADPLVARAARVSAGKLAGSGLRWIR